MPIYSIKNNKLNTVSEKKIDLERDIQRLTEENIETLFGLTFVSGALNQEFAVKVQEQEFYIDTLAFDKSTNSFVIIEYKKDRSFSVIDQGFAYLSTMLNHKADFVLELNERLQKNYKKSDIDWIQSRVIFISPEFTNYQRNAINFKDLPIFLYEVRLYNNDVIEFDAIKPYRTTESIESLTKDKTIKNVSKEVKVYNLDDLVKSNWDTSKSLLQEFEKQLLSKINETKIKYTKKYIAYVGKKGKEWVNYVEIVPQQQGLKIYFRFPHDYIKSEIKIEDCSKVGHWTNGNSYIYLAELNQIPESINLSQESFKFINKN